MEETIKLQIVDLLNDLVLKLAPDANLRTMYGGHVIELELDVPKSRVGGIYVYGDYVTLELAKGSSFDDPDNILEGSGKLRRHIKLRNLGDLKGKCCQAFLKQAVSTT